MSKKAALRKKRFSHGRAGVRTRNEPGDERRLRDRIAPEAYPSAPMRRLRAAELFAPC